MIVVENLKKAYADHLVIEVPTLTLPEGIHWFRGANGSGKTTFFRVLAGMLPFEGNITLHNFDIRKQPTDYRLLINYGEAEPVFPPFLSAFDLIEFVRITKKGPKQQAERLIEALNVGHFMRQPVGTYSSGMLKKTSIILAMLGQPKVIILDEPLVTIDDASVEIVYQLIQEYHSQGVSFLLSSHQDFRFEKLPISGHFLVDNQQISKT